jgi:hypothetical protein
LIDPAWPASVAHVPPHARAVILLFAVFLTFARADFICAPSGWAISAVFPAEPKIDDQRTPSPQGDQLAERRYLEVAGEHLMVLRLSYPVVPLPAEREQLYVATIESFMKSRRGQIKQDEPWMLGQYDGQRLLVAQPSQKTHREVRLVQIGASLYFISAEWPGSERPSKTAAAFLASIDVKPDFTNSRLVEERERWREIKHGNFTLRYDGSRWFPDPQIADQNSVAMLRVDENAEAEFITSAERHSGAMEELVIGQAKQHAESVVVKKRGKKLRGSTSVDELLFTVRVEGATYENHGYFYSGTEGTVQLRAWSEQKKFPHVAGDIAELLNGLIITKAVAGAAAR